MLVEVGHTNSKDGKVITQTRISDDQREDESYLSSYIPGTDAQEVRDHLFDNPGLVSHLPGNTAILDVVNPIRDALQEAPTWVAVIPENRDPAVAADFERFLSEFFRCSRGKPDNVEDEYWTLHHGTVYAPGDAPEGE